MNMNAKELSLEILFTNKFNFSLRLFMYIYTVRVCLVLIPRMARDEYAGE